MREKITCTDRVKNEVLQEVKKERNIIHTTIQGKAKWIGHLHGSISLINAIESTKLNRVNSTFNESDQWD
jgi:hypothetical protein